MSENDGWGRFKRGGTPTKEEQEKEKRESNLRFQQLQEDTRAFFASEKGKAQRERQKERKEAREQEYVSREEIREHMGCKPCVICGMHGEGPQGNWVRSYCKQCKCKVHRRCLIKWKHESINKNCPYCRYPI